MKTRLYAGAVHFVLSACFISLFVSMAYFVWYPAPLYSIHSVFDVIKIALSVDLNLGPLLTMVVFSATKPRAV